MAGSSRAGSDLAIRRKMRKGTHSCFECRRRKIRCIFSSDNPSVCTECFARGSRCVDQEHATADSIVDHRKNLRERVSRLESLVDQLLEDKSDRGAAETLNTLREVPSYPVTPSSSNAASLPNPSEKGTLLSSFFNDASRPAETVASDAAQYQFSTKSAAGNGTEVEFQCSTESNISQFFATDQAKGKVDRIRQTLISALPPFDDILKILRTNGNWWLTFKSKCPGTTSQFKDLLDFAQQAYHTGTPSQLGTLALAVGISQEGDELDHYLNLVNQWILSDDEYASTLEGMECIILSSKCYADIGQPRKAWVNYRRGLTFAQLLGLHRNHSLSADRDSVWWALFAGDRFMSLLLGLPYGIPDHHCDLELKGESADFTKSPLHFFQRTSVLAGKVIDRCQGNTKLPSLSSALDLDAELDDMASQVPPGWWDISPLLADCHREQAAAELRERVMMQVAFNQIRTYLHLPYMLQSGNNPRYEYSRTTCLKSARETLRLYHILRIGTAEPLYECKAVDFLGFTSATLVVLGLLGYGRSDSTIDPKQEEEDWRMIEVSMDIFQRAASERGGKVAAQSYSVLEQLSKIRHIPAGPNDPEHVSKIAIPYFGTITVRRGHRFQTNQGSNASAKHSKLSSTTPSSSMTSNSPFLSNNPSMSNQTPINQFPTPPLSTGTQSTTANDSPQQLFAADPFIAYDGFYNMPAAYDQGTNLHQNNLGGNISGEDNLMSLASTAQWGLNSLQMGMGAGHMDIDQDWTMFMNDQNMNTGILAGFGGGGGGGGGLQSNSQGQMHQGLAPGQNFFGMT